MNDAWNTSLKEYFGHEKLRPGQLEVIRCIESGYSTLAILPTGGGKSLCYQLPAIVMGGLTVVVSPLIALMRDQVDQLLARGVRAVRFDSSVAKSHPDDTGWESIKEKLLRKEISLLYLSPERLGSPEVMAVLKTIDIQMIAIDEAHCVSEWGHRFRPDYLKLEKWVRLLKPRTVLALTATASPMVAREIRKVFKILKRHQVQTSFFRPNLHFGITACEEKDKISHLICLLKEPSAWPAIVYGTRRETVETLARLLNENKITARAYHAGMSTEARDDVQDGFVAGRFSVICATIAFGMGVDMPNIRSVVHYQPPHSPEGWIQESGRAGRDGLPSRCEMLVSGNDRSVLEGMVLAHQPSYQAVKNMLRSIFSQGKRAIVSRYDMSTLNDVSSEMVNILIARLETGGWITEEQGSWLWCHAVPLLPVDQVLAGFKPSEQQMLRPLLLSRTRVSLMEMSGGTPLKQLKLMGLLSELHATGDVKMSFSHSLSHFRIRRVPEDFNAFAEGGYEVFQNHVKNDLHRIAVVMDLITSDTCIVAGLLQYFGETLDATCGCCSSCRGDERVSELPVTEVDSVTPEELQKMANLIDEGKSALASPERLSRFLCGIYSPAMMRYRLYRRDDWGMLKRFSYEDVLAFTRARFYGGR